MSESKLDDVIWSLGRCSCGVPDACRDCKYDKLPARICVQHLTKDALELLKKQEAVEPKHNPLSPTDWFCGKCGMCISRFHDYCPSCGQAVKWE